MYYLKFSSHRLILSQNCPLYKNKKKNVKRVDNVGQAKSWYSG